MTTTPFLDGWTVRRNDETVGTLVRLPHDAMIAETRSAAAPSGNHGAWFPGGVYVYEKTWAAPADALDRDYVLHFEGVYGNARVVVDGREVARVGTGYREFRAPLTGLVPGATARIEVHVDNTDQPNSRWYTGSGIIRPVHLESAGRIRFGVDGIRIITRELGRDARVDVIVQVDGVAADADPREGGVEVEVEVEVGFAGQAVTRRTTMLAASGSGVLTLDVPSVRAWSAETPHLYDVLARVRVAGEEVDERRFRTGLRTIEVDARSGLRVNGEPVLLRGACVHHDNGLLGAATFAAAEHRRARLLKEGGFNAIRSSHNPLSRHFLDACDELGLYVMDELTDVWFRHKTVHDGADRFEASWRDDARSMVIKDRNRPSVIMYSIGNEIAESATDEGVRTARDLHRFIADLDPSRPTTLAVNLLLNLMASKGKSAFEREAYTGEVPAGARKKPKREATSTAANALTAQLGRVMNLVSALPAADKASRDALAEVDVAGYNYAYTRYAGDRKRHPERVVVGSESMPGDLPAIWKRVEAVPGVIGDFMWTGWDYLGEAGIGTWSYGDAAGGINKPYPALVAGCGVFDITGTPGAPLLLTQAVWGITDTPGLAVRPLDVASSRVGKTPWRSSDALPTWSWGALRGAAEIEVYSDGDRVEVLLNGRSLGRKRAGAKRGFVTRFRTAYEPGELVAVAFRRGVETGRTTLRSASAPTLRLRAETPNLHGPDDLAYVWIELADPDGVVDHSGRGRVEVDVEGAGVLVALGSAQPSDEERFGAASHDLFRGRALAIIRGGQRPGPVTITARSEQHGTTVLELTTAADAGPNQEAALA